MDELKLQNVEGGVVLTVKVVPGSSRTALAGVLDGMLKLKVAAAPEKGKANKCLMSFLAKKLGLRGKDVEIVSGQTNPVKRVKLSGVSAETLRNRLGQ